MRGKRFQVVMAVALAGVLVSGCGSRRGIDEISAAAGGQRFDPVSGEVLDDGLVSLDGTDGAGVAGVAGSSGAIGSGHSAGSRGGTPGGPPGGPAAGGTGGSGSGADVAPPTGSPIRIGVVGTMSGVGGTQLGSARAVQAWAQAKNQSGGLAGHPVEVVVVDDGGDPARFRAALQQLVEQNGVVAFVGALAGFTLTDGAVAYLEEKRVPVVGGDRLSALWNTSPMMFPQGSAGDAVIWNHMVNTLRLGGVGTPIGWVACQEAQICKDADRLWQDYAPALGLDVRYRAQVSVAQPNFTAECTRASQAGVEIFLLGTDANSTRRIANDCARQGYEPRFAVLQTSDEMAEEPALADGFYGSATFPWVMNDTPATQEFQDVMARFAPGVGLSAHASSGWVAAKLFEAAAAGFGDDPTPADVLEGLWALSDETLGGLTSPLNFVRDEGAPPVYCFFPMVIAEAKWIASPRELICRAPD